MFMLFDFRVEQEGGAILPEGQRSPLSNALFNL